MPTHLKAPPNHYDAAWKLVIEHLFRPFLEMLFPPVAALVDWSRKPVFLDGQLQAILPEPGRFSWEGSDCEADASASRGVSEARAGTRPVTSERRRICGSRSSKHDRAN